MRNYRALHFVRGGGQWVLSLLRRLFASTHGAATDFLVEQHRIVEDLLDRFELASYAEKRQIFDALAPLLLAYDEVERGVFYPACARALDLPAAALTPLLVELGVVRFTLQQAAAHVGASDFDAYVAALAKAVRQHACSDVRRLYAAMNREVPGDELELLRHAMYIRLREIGDRGRGPTVAATRDATTVAARQPLAASVPLRHLRLVK